MELAANTRQPLLMRFLPAFSRLLPWQAMAGHSIQACTSSSGLSVAEMVAQTASQFVSEQLLPGFVYLEEYSAYYNSETGYFYDPVRSSPCPHS
jgi:hypothetical protein